MSKTLNPLEVLSRLTVIGEDTFRAAVMRTARNICPATPSEKQLNDELPFTWKRESTLEGDKIVVYLPINQESFADSLIAHVFLMTAIVVEAEIRPTVKCTDEFKLEENQIIRLFLSGALNALRWKSIPSPIKGSTEFVAGFNHIVAKRLPYRHIPKRWLKCRTWELSKLMNRTSVPVAPKALSSLWSLWDHIPRWDETNTGTQWLKDLRKDFLPHGITYTSVSKVMTNLETSIYSPQITNLNQKIKLLNEEITLDRIWADGRLPDLSSSEVCVEKRTMQAKLDSFVPSRLNLLYKDHTGRTIKKNRKVPINVLIKQLDLVTYYIHFNPSMSLGYKCPSIPASVLNANDSESALLDFLSNYEGDFPYKDAVLADLARHLA